jgi:MmyB-like transcription regulator ligand binding domain
VVDRAWELVAGNRGLALLTEGVAADLLEPPVNALRLALHPAGMAPRITNLGEWRAHILHRLRRQVALTGDPALAALLDELAAYPGPAPENGAAIDAGAEIVVPLLLRGGDRELAFFSTVATFGTAVDVTVAELSIESFLPADAATAAAMREFVRARPALTTV